MQTTTTALDIAEPILKRLARRVLKGVPACDADDIRQNVRLLLFTKIVPGYDPARGGLEPYLNVAIARALSDEYEKRGRAAKRAALDIDEVDEEQLVADDTDPAIADDDAVLITILAALDDLPSDMLSLAHDLIRTTDCDAIAKKRGVKTDTVYKQTWRLRRRLMALLAA